MRLTVPILICIALTSAAGAESLRLPPTEQQPQSAKTLPLKGAAAKPNGCASYGQGFTMVEGTCVKIGGMVRAGTVIGR
jgi:hypothetical protein